MPSINLRLTEEEHRELETWARDGHRSIQKEIIYRLFAGVDELGYTPIMDGDVVVGSVVPTSDEDRKKNLEALGRPPAYFPEREFKPDFKGKK